MTTNHHTHTQEGYAFPQPAPAEWGWLRKYMAYNHNGLYSFWQYSAPEAGYYIRQACKRPSRRASWVFLNGSRPTTFNCLRGAYSVLRWGL